MKYGVYQFSTDYAIRIDDLARETEARGFESLFVPEHTHIPVSRSSPWPGGPNLPKEYWHTLDPFVTLTAAAAVTTRLKVGTGICLVIERDPITLAKEVASLDHFSGGRVLFGIGGGWNAEEMEHHGTDFGSRWKVLRERIAAMKEIWTKDEAEYHGKFVNFDKIWSFPKPVQKPHPPILMGGSGPHARQRAADFDGHWMPIVGRDSIDEGIADLRQRAEKAGRDPATVTVSLFGARPDEGKLAAWRDLGIHRALFNLPSAGRDEVLPLLDKYAAVAAKIG
ncbi:MAG TPA: LLM class F420-dependent oxidoreductase [Methylomirabilota bacterium]|jgi:probable F420-dependent oxidoreductase|nr:LLM class F420-dependent oxidoreductase [Methylomirabilota bacterium]